MMLNKDSSSLETSYSGKASDKYKPPGSLGVSGTGQSSDSGFFSFSRSANLEFGTKMVFDMYQVRKESYKKWITVGFAFQTLFFLGSLFFFEVLPLISYSALVLWTFLLWTSFGFAFRNRDIVL